jgi:hypothetical protein
LRFIIHSSSFDVFNRNNRADAIRIDAERVDVKGNAFSSGVKKEKHTALRGPWRRGGKKLEAIY